MTVFAILMPEPQPELQKQIIDSFADDLYVLSDMQWLVSSQLTIYEVSAKIKLHDPKNLENPSLGNAVIFATSSYYGKAPATLWDWLKSKLEAPKHG